MGAWATDYFGNDGALDWLAEFRDSPNWAFAEKAISLDFYGYVEVDEGTAAIAACSIVAARLVLGTPKESSIELGNTIWPLIRNLHLPSEHIIAKATEALAFVSSNGELFELWQEADPNDFEAWNKGLELLSSVLKQT